MQSDWVLEEGPGRLIRLLLNGATGPITVNGKEWGSPAGMLAFKDALSDDQIAYVLTYIRQSPVRRHRPAGDRRDGQSRPREDLQPGDGLGPLPSF